MLQGIAARITELYIADLSQLLQLSVDAPDVYAGTAALARLVIIAGTEPQLTLTRARYEIALQAGRDPALRTTIQAIADLLHRLVGEVVTHWQPAGDPLPKRIVEQQTNAMLTFIDGVLMSFVLGRPAVHDEAELDQLLQALLTGIETSYLAGAEQAPARPQ
ncbi:TetR family transcriptional regulator [Mycobacterium sp. M1]|uniref:TetR family transcriptional regulator n=1 Tax=Mycolicibacter acidiphilus TaxID=2835306 RepID=A0ABS5RJM7_9MYCO|nr:TetR family transcriptional regulator [Mycolicibacter acidiphilus]MBS9533814.1 TetR family transcriptional regulator [Mycolicibacter acidiphilus]